MVQVLLIAAFAVVYVRDQFGTLIVPGIGPFEVVSVYLGGLGAIGLLMVAVTWRAGRRLDRSGSVRAIRGAEIAVLASRVAAVALHCAAVLVLGWLDLVRGWVGDLILIDELIATAPVLAVFVLGWWALYPIDRRLREAVLVRELDEGRTIRPMPSRTAYVVSAVRHQAAFVLVPIMLMLAWMETVNFGLAKLPRLGMPAWLPPLVAEGVGMAVVLTIMPLVLRRVWSTSVLGPGPLRERLTQMCVRCGVRVREVLVWGTHGTMINGAVMGFFGPVRYILLTDALLESLPAAEVEAVMAHELGHVKRRHMIWLGIAAVSSIVLAQLAIECGLGVVLGWAVLERDTVQAVVAVASLLAGLGVFGFVSRRFEWQADAFAVQHLSEGEAGSVVNESATRAMAGALESVARLNRIPREKFGWRHGSIGTRQRKIVALLGQRTDGLAVDRSVRRLKLMVAVAMAAAVAGAVVTSGWSAGGSTTEQTDAVREDARNR